MKKLSFLFLLTLSAAVSASGVLLESTFDKYSTLPDRVKNPATQTTGIPHDLQLRMKQGPANKNNAVELHNREFIRYTGKGNFNAQCGTVSFWVRPLNWKIHGGSKYFHKMFALRIKNKYVFYIVRQGKMNNIAALYCGATVFAKPKWELNTWHKVDVTWNSTALTLYIDGKTPSADSRQVHNFKTPPKFPEDLSKSFIYLNDNMAWLVDPSWKTVYDEVTIYDRVLSPSEIKANYEKYFPSKKEIKKPFARIPAILPVSAQFPGKYQKPLEAYVKVSQTAKNLILDYFVPDKNVNAQITRRDGHLWMEDSAEFHAIGKDGKARQFIVNPAGGIYDALNGNAKWNSGIKVETSRNKDFWRVKMMIPLSDLNPGKTLPVNFGVTESSDTRRYYSWSQPQTDTHGFGDKRYLGTIELGGKGKFIGITQLGELENGKLDVKFQSAPGIKAQCDLVSAGTKYQTFSRTLSAGEVDLSVTAKTKKGKLLYAYYRDFIVNPPLLMNILGNSVTRTIDCHVNFSASGTQKGSGVVELSGNGKVYSSKKFSSNRGECEVILPIPENLPAGKTYDVTVKFGPHTLSKKFRYPDLSKIHARVGIDHTVPKPWHKVTTKGNKVYVLDREYDFSQGPFPVQMTSRGEKLLTRQPQFQVNGKVIKWSQVKFGKNHGDYVELSADGTFDGGKAVIKGQVWFDGMYRFDISLTPAGTLELKKLGLTWNMPRNAAKYVLVPVFKPWKKDKLLLKWRPGENNGLLWLTGVVNGIAWSCDSDANWIIDPNKDNVVVTRNAKEAFVNINILARPAKLTQTAKYSMVLQATPPKRVDYSEREIISGARHIFPGKGRKGVDYAMLVEGWVREHQERCLGVVSAIPANPEKFGKALKRLHKRGMKTYMYSMPSHLGKPDPAYDYLYKACATLPGFAWEARDPVSKEKYLIEPTCGHTLAGDWKAWNMDQLYKNYPDLDGCYFDIAGVKNCTNALHGCSGKDAFGKTFSTGTIFHLREFMLRISKIHQKYGRRFGLHSHNRYFPFVHCFADYWMPGEEMYTPVSVNPEWAYFEGITPEAYQSAWNCEIRGMMLQNLFQHSRVGGLQSKPKSDRLFSRELHIRSLAACVLYDNQPGPYSLGDVTPSFQLRDIRKQLNLKKAKFYGYWIKPVAKSAPKVEVSWYKLDKTAPYSHLFCVVNTNRKTVPTALVFDWKKLEIPPAKQFKDLWTNKVYSSSELAKAPLDGHNFMLLVPLK